MRKGFDIRQWVREVQDKKLQMDALMHSLEEYGACVTPNKDNRDAAGLHYFATFEFPEKTTVTIGILLMGWQADSDLVIETMITLPQARRSLTFGSLALAQVLKWATDHGFNEVRATQVMTPSAKRFWVNNGFVPEEDNPCDDLVRRISR